MDTNQLQLENEKLNARLEKAKEVFKQQAADIKAKDEAYLKLKDEYDELIKEHDTYAQTNAKLNNEINTLNEQLQSASEVNSNIDELQEELNTTKKALLMTNEELSEFEYKCARYDDVIKTLNEKNDGLVSQYNTLQNTYNQLNEKYGDLENKYNNSEHLRKSYTESTNKLNTEVARLQDIIVSKDTAYKSLQDTYNDLNAEHIRDGKELNNKIDTLESELSEKTEALNKALNEIQLLTTRLNAESGKIEEVKTKAEVAVTSIKKKLQALNDGLGDEFNIFG